MFELLIENKLHDKYGPYFLLTSYPQQVKFDMNTLI